MNMQNLQPKYEITLEGATLHIAKGNSKIGKGIYAFSSLPGNADHLLTAKGELLTNIPGTCSHHCETCFAHGCYAVNSARLHHNVVIKSWGENTLLLRAGLLKDKLIEYIDGKQGGKQPIEIFRINVSGEVESVAEFEMWNELAIKYPNIRFGIYTKNFEDLDTFMQKYGSTAPNFCINISQWHGCADEILAKYPNQFNVFEYDDSNLKHNDLSEEDLARLAQLHHCPAVDFHGHHAKDKNGNDITCDKCLRCYRKTGKTTAVYAH